MLDQYRRSLSESDHERRATRIAYMLALTSAAMILLLALMAMG